MLARKSSLPMERPPEKIVASSTLIVRSVVSFATSSTRLSRADQRAIGFLVHRIYHCACHASDGAWPENAAITPALETPLRSLCGQQTIAQSGKHPLLKAILAVICLVVVQDVAYRGGVIHNHNIAEG